MIDRGAIGVISGRILEFLDQHAVSGHPVIAGEMLDGAFCLHARRHEPDLYGMVDSVYILYTIGELERRTDKTSRGIWARRILACQDQSGWFSLRNLRGHRPEHATAYAIGALRLLEVTPDEAYVEMVRPLEGIRAILGNRAAFSRWIERMGFYRLSDVWRKDVGWHHVWRGSHIVGGVAAAVGMVQDCIGSWWPEQVDVAEWFRWLFEWLDRNVNPATGYWQRAFWNRIVRRPTLIDLGGAAHFYWIYEAARHRYCYPERIIESTISLQRPTGLYKQHPFCIDLDANFSIIRSFLQLDPACRSEFEEKVRRAVERNFDAIANILLTRDLSRIYSDLHGPPGALAAMMECTKLPGFSRTEDMTGWRHVLDRVWWL